MPDTRVHADNVIDFAAYRRRFMESYYALAAIEGLPLDEAHAEARRRALEPEQEDDS